MSGHHHGHHHHGSTGNIKIAFFINFLFSIIEIIGGFYTNSIAILSDALHDLGDTFSLGLAWYFQRLSERGRDSTFSYGYKRFSLLGAMINAIVLLIGSVLILYNAIPRLLNPESPDSKGMILIALLGVIFNGAAVLKLKKGKSINEKVVSLHLMEDILGWLAVLIGSIIMYFTDLPVIDPILSILITLFILYNVYGNLKQTFRIILQGTPVNADENAIRNYLQNQDQIDSFHDLHIWSMDGEYNILTLHVVLKSNFNNTEIENLKTKLKTELKNLGIHHPTIEVEHPEEQCNLVDC